MQLTAVPLISRWWKRLKECSPKLMRCWLLSGRRWMQSLYCFAVKNFAGRCPEAFVDSSEIQEMLRGSRDID
jgi:hypothetical protein